MTSTDFQLNALKSSTPDRMLQLFTPRQPGRNDYIIHTQIIYHTVPHHGNAPINRCEGSTTPPSSKAQNSNTCRNNWYHHPHGQEAEVYSTSCNSCQEENEPSRFLQSISVWLLQVCEITLFLKTLLSSWWHMLNRLQTLFLALSYTLICDICISSVCFHGGQWRHIEKRLSYLPCISCT